MDEIRTTVIVFSLLSIYNIFLAVKQRFYYSANDERMQNHILNKKYRLNKIKNIDYKMINNIIGFSYVSICIICCLVMVFIEDKIGLLCYVSLTFIGNRVIANYIANKYNRSAVNLNRNGGK